jgi:hypothetical protein
MNQCPACNAAPHRPCHGRTFSRARSAHHSERITWSLDLGRSATAARRSYIDALHTPRGSQVSSPACEHCAGEKSAWVRHDELRGWVCPVCDDSLDAMLSMRVCDKCGGENDRVEESNYCARCSSEYQERIAAHPETRPVGTP